MWSCGWYLVPVTTGGWYLSIRLNTSWEIQLVWRYHFSMYSQDAIAHAHFSEILNQSCSNCGCHPHSKILSPKHLIILTGFHNKKLWLNTLILSKKLIVAAYKGDMNSTIDVTRFNLFASLVTGNLREFPPSRNSTDACFANYLQKWLGMGQYAFSQELSVGIWARVEHDTWRGPFDVEMNRT